MGYFNYFIKQLIRIFTRKFFWVILVFLFLFFVCFILDVNAVDSIYSFTYGNLDDVTAAQQVVGSSIWNNTNYDIFVFYDPNPTYGSSVIYYDTTNLSDNTIYRVNTDKNDVFYNLDVLPFNFINSSNNSSIGNNATDYHIKTLYSNNRDEYYESFAPSSHPDWGTNIYGSKSNHEIYCYVVRSHFDFVDISGNIISRATNPRFTNPYIVNSSEISNWSFDNLVISLGSISYNFSNYYGLVINNGYDNLIDLSTYYDVNDNTFVIPKNQISNYINIRDGNIIDFELSYRSMTSVNLFDLGNYTITLTSQEQEEINQDSDKFVQGQILEEQQKTTKAVENVDNSVNNLHNSITDSSVDDITNGDLPSDNTEDITSEGVNGIFTSIYNAFCTGNAQDIVFPIPFTNKNISLSPNYVNDMLSNSGAGWVITIIQAFWWYLISRFIIKDVMNKINKIKSGNIEDIETTNIRGDML